MYVVNETTCARIVIEIDKDREGNKATCVGRYGIQYGGDEMDVSALQDVT